MTSPARLISSRAAVGFFLNARLITAVRLRKEVAHCYCFKLANFGYISVLLIKEFYIFVFRTYQKQIGSHNTCKIFKS